MFQPSEGKHGTSAIWPGLLVVLGLALAGRYIHQVLPELPARVMGESIVGMLLGIILANTLTIPDSLSRGIKFSFQTLLRVAIVLLGARFSLQQLVEIGGDVLLIIIGLITLALVLAYQLSKMTHISHRLGTLIGLGAAICGNTAITVAAPLIQARDEEISFAIATNTLFGTLAVLFYPLIGNALGLTPEFFGTWAGIAVNDTSQVVAVGFSQGVTAGEAALAVKLTRNALLGVVLVVIGYLYAQGGERKTTTLETIRRSIPLFILGFLLMALVNTFHGFDGLSTLLDRDLLSDFTIAAKFLILTALVGVGLNTRFSAMRELGWTPLLIGFTVAGVCSVIGFFAISFFID